MAVYPIPRKKVKGILKKDFLCGQAPEAWRDSVTENYAGKGYDRYIFTATGEIDNKNALVAVVVNGYQTGENKFCLHEAKIIEADSLSMTETAKKQYIRARICF